MTLMLIIVMMFNIQYSPTYYNGETRIKTVALYEDCSFEIGNIIGKIPNCSKVHYKLNHKVYLIL